MSSNKCGQCGAPTTDICNQNGCGFLESGNGAPVVERHQPSVEALEALETFKEIARSGDVAGSILWVSELIGRAYFPTLKASDPVYQAEWSGDGGGRWIDVDREQYDHFSTLANYHVRTLYTAPPELAELQATIARLTAENERLKGGQPASVPVGYKLVPLIPTEAMVEAGINTRCGDDEHQDYRDVYSAMIGATP